jgi:hypothetical protein
MRPPRFAALRKKWLQNGVNRRTVYAMADLIFIVSLSFGSVIVGYLVQRLFGAVKIVTDRQFYVFSKYLKFICIAIIEPIPIVNSFWKITPPSGRLLLYSVIGATAILLGGLSAIVLVRIFHISPKRAGSVFTCSMFANIGALGSIIGFTLFGDMGYMFVRLYAIFEVFLCYAIGFPLSAQISEGMITKFRLDFSILRKQPMAFIPLAAVFFGVAFNYVGVPVSPFVDSVSDLAIPFVTGMIGFAIGITLHPAHVGNYKKEIALISAAKFVIIPAVVITLGYLLGFHTYLDGAPFKLLVFLAFIPSAFLALVPPAMYDFDLDCANSGWLVTTVIYMVLFPVLYFIVM